VSASGTLNVTSVYLTDKSGNYRSYTGADLAAASQVENASMKACMPEQGFVLSRKSEHDARCPPPPQAALPMSERPR